MHVAQGGGWDAESAALWPPAFKAAARTLLLARGDDGGVAWLPHDLLLTVLERAAFPMSAWM